MRFKQYLVEYIDDKEAQVFIEKFLKKEGTQFKKDIEDVKNHTVKRRGLNKKDIPEGSFEYAITSRSTEIKFVFALKQDYERKGTAVLLPVTIIRDPKFRITRGIHIMIESI